MRLASNPTTFSTNTYFGRALASIFTISSTNRMKLSARPSSTSNFNPARVNG